MIGLRLLVLFALLSPGVLTVASPALAQPKELVMGNVNPPKHGTALAASGSEHEAIPILRSVFEERPGYAELLERLPAAGLFPDDGQLIARLIGTRAESAPSGPGRV